ncbi:polyadenylation and cleavage factor homolog 4 [Cannabis sativa]|uniref:polyadenylation and cleavage factor homolog 4 n=1 Tax=Cannabis sativa TaxID=3483 RepID=UPI0029C9F31D|nr:polyadenylation and cleavage factor homolog 4 [Cannabis sativa]
MEMESSRRPFDRSREPGLKKPRLNEEPERGGLSSNPNTRSFPQRPTGNNPLVSSRSSSGGGGGYQPQPLSQHQQQQQQHQELVSQYKTAIAELTFNSKPIITNLTIIAGENLHAAKAIAGTVCHNILEVPSDQKLPSLYLLDSIVKNIGRDYIKNFAARLPEVFIKAYRQVDPPVHTSMRHLFGTWKGVFPSHTLQMIEKELGFVPAANGSSTANTTSRPDSQSNRPLHNSIHVNPKYLEGQRLQQLNRAKGLATDVSGSIANSVEDVENMDRATDINTGRAWADPSSKLNRSQRGTSSEGIHEKSTAGEYADYDYSSDFPRNSGFGIGRGGVRVSESEHDKLWHGDGGNFAESVSGQRNSFSIKHGFPNYPAPKSTNVVNTSLQSAQNVTSRSSGGVSSSSWKNSEEEEFMWDGMNSRSSDHGASVISSKLRKDRSASDDSDKSGFEDHVKPQSLHDYTPRGDKEASIDSLSVEHKDLPGLGHRISSPWLLQEPQLTDGLPRPVSSSIGFTTNAVLGSSGALTQQRFQSLKSGQSSLRQRPPSPTLTARHPLLSSQNSTDHERVKAHSLSHPDSKVFSGQLNLGVPNIHTQDSLPISSSHVRQGKMAKSLPHDVQASSPSVPTFPLRHASFSQQAEDSTESDPLGLIQKTSLPQVSVSGILSTNSRSASERSPLTVETLGDSSTASLLAAVMKSGILSKSSITNSSLPNLNFPDSGQLPSQSSQPPLPSGRTPTQVMNSGFRATSTSSSGHSSYDGLSASSKIPKKKVEQPSNQPARPLSSSPAGGASENVSNVAKKASDPISNLLSSLVAKGLISASKTELPAVIPPEVPPQTQKKSRTVTSTGSVPLSSVSASPVFSIKNDGSSLSKPDSSVVNPQSTKPEKPQSTNLEIKNLLGFDFKQDKIREFHSSVVSELLDGFEHQCAVCSLKLKHPDQLKRHLEWHDLKKANDSTKASRNWYFNSRDWVAGVGCPSGFELAKSVDKPVMTIDKDEPMVPADESQCVCVLCGEIFEDFYCEETDEWMFKGALHMIIPSGTGELASNDKNVSKGPIVHKNCVSESSLPDLGLVSNIKMEQDV